MEAARMYGPTHTAHGSGYCEVCGRHMGMPAQDPLAGLTTLTQSIAGPVTDALRKLLAGEFPWAPLTGVPMGMPMGSPLAPPLGAPLGAWMTPGSMPGHPHHHRHHEHGCGCDDDCEPCEGCRPDPCHCRCCIDDADLAVYARLGERRLIPLSVVNHWRRERQVTLKLSDFATRGGRTPINVTARIVPETTFTLGACEERDVIIELAISEPGTQTPAGVEERAPALPDVDDCTVLYALLHVEGCETRPRRIAVAVLPRDCAPFRVTCRCGCC